MSKETPELTHEIQVYLDNGIVYAYKVDGEIKAREHASAICHSGYRHADDGGNFVCFPVHRISKVKVLGGVKSEYPAEERGT